MEEAWPLPRSFAGFAVLGVRARLLTGISNSAVLVIKNVTIKLLLRMAMDPAVEHP
jgi:hypothetical protein